MNRIAVGAVAGLIFGLAIGYTLYGDWGAALLPAVLTALLGAVVGLLARQALSRGLVLLAGAVLGALTYWFIGRDAGAITFSVLLGALTGLGIAAVVAFRGRRTPTQQRPPQ